jgi:hypothetical protein
MLKKLKLRALQPGQWARIIVPDYNCWKELGERITPGDLVDVCIMPSYEPSYSYSRHFDWCYRAAYRRPDTDHFCKERHNGYLISTSDLGLINPTYSNLNWDTTVSEEHNSGKGNYLYEPASDDPALCPGGDWSRYECSLCGKYVKPFSNDDGDLLCPWCEVTGLVILDDEQLDRLEKTREFARSMGLAHQLERQLGYLADYGHNGDRPLRQCVLSYDFAPHSFSFSHYLLPDSTGDGKRQFSYNGGLIYQGPSCPGDGSFPSLSVSLNSGTGWFCHT